MPQQRTLVDEAAELIACLSQDQLKALFMRIPGMQGKVMKRCVRFTYRLPLMTTPTKPPRARVRYDEDDDIIK